MQAVSRPKLLLADDSVTIRKVVELTFADEGVDVTAVANGEEAMQKFVEAAPDIVLVDVNMPDPTGYLICEMIKQDEATKHIPVVLLVGSFEPFDQDEAERVGADGFMIKPFQSIRDLVAKVRELLAAAHGEPEASATSDDSDIDSLYNRSFAETHRVDSNEVSDKFLGNVGMDDEIIETTHPAKESMRAGGPFDSEAEEPILGLDWSAGPAVEPTLEQDAAIPANGGYQSPPDNGENHLLDQQDSIDFEKIDTLRDMDVAPASVGLINGAEPSEEFISLVARRVVEKLSDKVIREIAKEAVPRIAENLIREALEEEGKS